VGIGTAVALSKWHAKYHASLEQKNAFVERMAQVESTYQPGLIDPVYAKEIEGCQTMARVSLTGIPTLRELEHDFPSTSPSLVAVVRVNSHSARQEQHLGLSRGSEKKHPDVDL